MTKQKDLKKHIRARAAKTGESYSEARRNLLAERTVAEQKAMAETFAKPIVEAAKRQREGLAALAAGITVTPIEHCPTMHGECVLGAGHRSDAHGDDHRMADGTWWNVGRTVEPGDENLSAMKARVPLAGLPRIGEDGLCEACGRMPHACACGTAEATTVEAQGLTDRVRELSGVPVRVRSEPALATLIPEELVQVRGFAQPVPKAMADAIEVLRKGVRDDVSKQDAVFESLFEQAKEAEPELLWVGKGGQVGQAVFRTEFDKGVVESAKAYPLTAYERQQARWVGPAPADLWRKQEVSEEEQKTLAEAVANSPACICGDALGSVRECPFHHPPVVLDPEKTTLEAAASVDVARELLRRTLVENAKAEGLKAQARNARIVAAEELRGVAGRPLNPSFAAASEAVRGKTEYAAYLDDANHFDTPPALPVKDVAPLLELLKYINGGDAHPDEIREEAREALDAFDKLHPKVLTALIDPNLKADSLDLDSEEEISVVLNGKKATLPRVADYETIVARAGMSGTPSMTFRKGRTGGILHPGEPLFVEKKMVLNVAHTGNA